MRLPVRVRCPVCGKRHQTKKAAWPCIMATQPVSGDPKQLSLHLSEKSPMVERGAPSLASLR